MATPRQQIESWTRRHKREVNVKFGPSGVTVTNFYDGARGLHLLPGWLDLRRTTFPVEEVTRNLALSVSEKAERLLGAGAS